MAEQDKKILIAFDGSEASIRAIRQTAQLLGAKREVVIFTAWESNLVSADVIPVAGELSPMPPAPDGEKIRQGIQAAKEHAQQVADRGVQIAKLAGLQASSKISTDSHSIAASIIRAITDPEICLLVIGAHRHGPIASIFLGSTAQTLLHEVVTPMLVIRPLEK